MNGTAVISWCCFLSSI